MDYRNKTNKELEELKSYFNMRDNVNAFLEICHFQEFYGKTVKVVKGRKVPKGTTGVVFWLQRQCYGKYGDPWGIYSSTRCGIKTADEKVYWTSTDNLEVV